MCSSDDLLQRKGLPGGEKSVSRLTEPNYNYTFDLVPQAERFPILTRMAAPDCGADMPPPKETLLGAFTGPTSLLQANTDDRDVV